MTCSAAPAAQARYACGQHLRVPLRNMSLTSCTSRSSASIFSPAAFGLARNAALGLALSLASAAGCASSSEAAMLPLLFPDDGAELSQSDDVNEDERGLQVDIRAESSRLGAGTAIELVIDGQPQATSITLDDNGELDMPDVTLPPGRHTVQVRTTTGSVASDVHEYTFRTLVIVSPEHGQSLGAADDRERREEGVQMRVDVDVFEIDRDEEIELRLDGKVVGEPVQASAAGRAAFSNVTLLPGTHTLLATVSGKDAVESEPVTVNVSSF